eukprot:3120262-Pyramimonas_sp.AAC.1
MEASLEAEERATGDARKLSLDMEDGTGCANLFWLRVRGFPKQTEAKMLDELRAKWTPKSRWGLDKLTCTHVVDVVYAWGRYYYGNWVWPKLPNYVRPSHQPL